MSLAKPYAIPGSLNFDEAVPSGAPPPDGNPMPRVPYVEPTWRPGAGQNQLLTKSPTNHYPPAVPVRPPFRVG